MLEGFDDYDTLRFLHCQVHPARIFALSRVSSTRLFTTLLGFNAPRVAPEPMVWIFLMPCKCLAVLLTSLWVPAYRQSCETE